MPDMKYSDEGTAFRYSGIRDYPEINRQAVKEMAGLERLDGFYTPEAVRLPL